MKKWSNLTSREKKMGVVMAIGAVFIIGGLAQATQGPTTQMEQPIKNEVSTKKESVVTYEEVTETEAIPFEKVSQESSSLEKGSQTVSTVGVNGEKTKIYKVTYSDGVETAREEISNIVTKEPVSEVTTIGTYVKPVVKQQPAPQSNCDPNYSGTCVPITSDVDCAGGSGNGPAYVSGPVYVVGSDIYDLDRDGDGVACE